jgi:hypothetical protein
MESFIPFPKSAAPFCDGPASAVRAVRRSTDGVSPRPGFPRRGRAAAGLWHRGFPRASAGVALCLLMAAGPDLSRGQRFTVGVTIALPTGLEPRSATIGDVNGDGYADLVVTNYTSGSVSVLLGDGIGGFGPRADFATEETPFMSALGDVSGDGKIDLAVANPNFNTVSVLLGDGSGGFASRADFAAGMTPVSVAIGDVNGDGKPDLVAVDFDGNAVSVLLGDGAGGFGARTGFLTGSNPRSVAIGDTNGDGKADLVTANYGSNTVSVLLGDGVGGFGAKADFATGAYPYEIASGDLNDDGTPDLAVANFGSSSVSVLLGNGAGGFGPNAEFATGSMPRSVAIGDVNGDGKADVVAGNVNANSVSVLLGNGAGGLGVKADFATGLYPRSVAIGDLNGDGMRDVAVAAFGSNAVSVLFGNSAGGFGAKTDFATGSLPQSVAVGDVSGDGRPDVVATNFLSSTVSVLLGNGAGGLGGKTDFTTGTWPYSVAIGDVSSDEKPDLVVVSGGTNKVSVLLGNGAGGFGAKTDFTTGTSPFSVAIGDVSGDGKPDLAVANHVSNTVSVLLGDGLGGFGVKTDLATGLNPTSVAIGDVSGDGEPDLVVANGSARTVSVLLGTGVGGFGTKADFATGSGPWSVAIGDLNGDGKPDLAVANDSTNTVSVLLGNGTGGFGAKADFATGTTPFSVAIGDANGDGRPDLAVGNLGGGVSVLLGDGAGGFGMKTDYVAGAQPRSVAMGDLDGDGRPDLVSANGISNTVSVLLGLEPTETVLAAQPSPVVLGTPLTLTASVAGTALGHAVPTDSVRFFDGTTLLGTSPVTGGLAAYTLAAPYLGERALTAVYKGDGKLFGSISAVSKVRVVSYPVPMEVEATAGAWVNPEPWHDWVSDDGGGAGAGIPIQAHIPDYLGEIEHVAFYYSTDSGSTWHFIADDVSGYEPPLNTLDPSVQMTGCGWSTNLVVPDSIPAGPIQFKTVAYPAAGDPVEDVTEHDYDPAPPSLGTTSIRDRVVIERDALGTDIYANGADIERIIIRRSLMDTTFVKGIPGIPQLAYDSMYCAPVAAAQCLQYFAGHGDGLVTGGLETSGLVQALAVGMGTNQTVAGTLPSRWVSGLGAWLATYGQGYTVRYYPHYSCDSGGSTWTRADWQRMRNELELCRDVLVGVFWDGGGGHAMTLDAITYPENADSTVTIGFKDPWTGGTATGDLDPATGHLANLSGAGGGGGAQIGLTMLVSREENVVGGGVTGDLVYDGAPPAGPPYHFEIPLPDPGFWFIHVTLVNDQGHATRITNVVEYAPDPAGLPGATGPAPRAFGLERGVPNPFRGETRVTCAVPRLCRVRLAVYEVAGREVKTLVDGELQPGYYVVPWDGRDQRGRAVAGGIYYLKMTAPDFERTTRVTLLH